MAELFPQDNAPIPMQPTSPEGGEDLIRAEDERRGPEYPTTPLEEPPVDWPAHPLYRAPDTAP